MSTRLRSRLFTIALAAVLAVATAVPGTASANEGKRPRGAATAVEAEVPTVGGFDCSGLVRWAYGRVGVDLPHSSYALYNEGRRVDESRLEPGDLLFFEGLGHVGLYLGRGRMVHAPQTGRDVEVVRLDGSNYGSRLIGARRVAAA